MIDEYSSIVSEPREGYGNPSDTPLSLINKSRIGVSMGTFSSLLNNMGLSIQDGARILDVSLRTIQRYDKNHLLSTSSSSKVLKLKDLNKEGLLTFNSQEAFNSWLQSPIVAIGHEKPTSLLDTPYGFEVITQILGRIRHGVFA